MHGTIQPVENIITTVHCHIHPSRLWVLVLVLASNGCNLFYLFVLSAFLCRPDPEVTGHFAFAHPIELVLSFHILGGWNLMESFEAS